MAGYGLKSFLIAQSLNQIEKAYGQNNSIPDHCHVRVSFATNEERTAKRVSGGRYHGRSWRSRRRGVLPNRPARRRTLGGCRNVSV
jgi:hypothetical protein